jgi:GPH family glycoside/pentoside/hexuronide:cation symporter
MENSIAVSGKKLSVKTKLIYAAGQFGDSVPYNLFSLFFLFYLTDVVGMNPTIAGTISSCAVIWNAIANPIVGSMSDNCRSRYGRRRPFMLVGFPMIMIAILMLFAPVQLTGTIQAIYYMLVALLFWTAYVVYLIPFAALGAELTDDYNERTSLRSYTSFIAYTILTIVSSGPAFIQSKMLPNGYTVQEAWNVTGYILVVLVAIFCFISWKGLAGTEKTGEKVELQKVPKENIFRTVKEIMSIKAYRVIVFMVVAYVIGATMQTTGLVYLLTYAAGLDYAAQSLFWLVTGIIDILIVPVIAKVAFKAGKKKTLMIAMSVVAVLFIAFGFIGIYNAVTIYAYAISIFIFALSFWILYVPLTYDIAEIDEWKFNKRREGMHISFVLFVQKIGAAFASFFVGVLLSAVGYQAGIVQSPEVIDGMVSIFTFVPAAFIIIAVIIFARYPITPQNFDALKKALAAKKAGEEYSTEEFKSIL